MNVEGVAVLLYAITDQHRSTLIIYCQPDHHRRSHDKTLAGAGQTRILSSHATGSRKQRQSIKLADNLASQGKPPA